MAGGISHRLPMGILILCALMTATASAGTIYVKADAAGANDGSSWTDAFALLQSALDAAVSDDQIWVAAGTYRPTSDYGLVAGSGEVQARLKHFRMKDRVRIYGGFTAVETECNQRNWKANVTILSGDIDGSGALSEGDSYHIFYHTQDLLLVSTAILDGFTITGASDSAMYNVYSSPTVSNCRFIGNSGSYGAGIYNRNSSPRISDCMFIDNRAIEYLAGVGGGIYCNYSDLVVENCMFVRNIANRGGAIGIICHSSPLVINCKFLGNVAANGAAIYNGSGCTTVLNSTFSSNSGAAIYYSDGTDLFNCTFTDNYGVTYGYNVNATVNMRNCIIWGNYGTLSDGYGTTTYAFCSVQTPVPGIGNMSSDPQFIRTFGRGQDGIRGTADDDYGDLRLRMSSPCVDMGSNLYVNGATDLAGLPRIVNGDANSVPVVDMGAYERQCATGPVGDLYDDCGINFADYAMLANQWSATPCSDANQWCSAADINHSGTVDIPDLALFASHWME